VNKAAWNEVNLMRETSQHRDIARASLPAYDTEYSKVIRRNQDLCDLGQI
jgi:hypothetical protein